MTAPPQSLPPHRERVLLLTLAAIQFLHIVDFMVMMPLGPQLMAELAINTGEFALLVSSYTFSAALTGLLMAAVIDRFERKRLMLSIFALFAVATAACGFVTDYPALLLARCAAGAFGGILGAQVHTMVGDLIPFERRGRASGTLMAAFSVSTVAGVPASLALANQFGWRAPFLLIALLSFIALIMAARTLPSLRGHLGTTHAHPLTAMCQALCHANHLRAMGFMALVIFASFMVVPYITIALIGNVGMAQADIPLIYLCGGMATLFSSRWIGRMADHHGKTKVYRAVAVGSLLPLLLITHLPPVPLWAALVSTTLFFVLVPGRMVPTMAIVTSAAAPAQRGTFLALNAVGVQLASGLAAAVSGLIVTTDAAGRLLHYHWVGYLAVLFTFVALWLVGRVRMPG